MRDLLIQLLSHITDEGYGPTIEVDVGGEIVEGVITADLADLIEQIREAVAELTPDPEDKH